MNRKAIIGTAATILFSFLCPFFAASDSQNSASLFLDYIYDVSEGYKLSLNPSDLKDKEVFSRISKGTSIWVGTKEKVVRGKFESEKKNEKWSSYRGGIIVEFVPVSQIPAGYILLSLKPLPDQKWKTIPLGTQDVSFLRQQIKNGLNSSAFPAVRIHSKALGDFILVNEELSKEGEFVSFSTILFKLNQNNWEKVSETLGQGTEVLVDVDGDGFPEVAGATGYKSFGWGSSLLLTHVRKNDIY